tara:strand:+ start:355 stop:870 length:516 start_codon:yes stop_codon:yes gene_type:complete
VNPEELSDKADNLQLKIIPIGAKHLLECLKLDELALNGIWTKAQWEKELKDSKTLRYGVIIDSKLIAFTSGWLIIDELQINAIVVHPGNRRFGLGKKLLSILIEESITLGAKKATLEVKSTNIPARNLYIKLGFKSLGSRKKYYKDGCDAILFHRDLIIKNLPKRTNLECG